jgi:hypothetical protein
LNWDYAIQLEARFKQEIDTLMKLAEAPDNTPLPEDMDVPKELKRRQDRLAVIAKAKQSQPARRRIMRNKKPSMMKSWLNVKNNSVKPAKL